MGLRFGRAKTRIQDLTSGAINQERVSMPRAAETWHPGRNAGAGALAVYLVAWVLLRCREIGRKRPFLSRFVHRKASLGTIRHTLSPSVPRDTPQGPPRQRLAHRKACHGHTLLEATCDALCYHSSSRSEARLGLHLTGALCRLLAGFERLSLGRLARVPGAGAIVATPAGGFPREPPVFSYRWPCAGALRGRKEGVRHS